MDSCVLVHLTWGVILRVVPERFVILFQQHALPLPNSLPGYAPSLPPFAHSGIGFVNFCSAADGAAAIAGMDGVLVGPNSRLSVSQQRNWFERWRGRLGGGGAGGISKAVIGNVGVMVRGDGCDSTDAAAATMTALALSRSLCKASPLPHAGFHCSASQGSSLPEHVGLLPSFAAAGGEFCHAAPMRDTSSVLDVTQRFLAQAPLPSPMPGLWHSAQQHLAAYPLHQQPQPQQLPATSPSLPWARDLSKQGPQGHAALQH
jgi:hypothetical protein